VKESALFIGGRRRVPASTMAPGDSKRIRFEPIGVVHTTVASADSTEADGRARGVIEIYEKFAEALDGIDGYSHLFVLGYFHHLRPEQIGPLKVRPRKLLRLGLRLEELPELGVFALDSPTRPNPIGLTLVRFVGRNGRNLEVEGLDYYDRTPVLDIKPYQIQYRAEEFTVPEWRSSLRRKLNRFQKRRSPMAE